ncbi:hypothetical protein [uncultured Proteiniphilum sp.]|uniref:tetratricopeptide repeat protein n=1 Tax=uncultured Proteiniphilum sp. TaxID=497637 RepID=UPI0026320405|nr:hypothetical protein [uncultured Proteiniphilum sp.]
MRSSFTGLSAVILFAVLVLFSCNRERNESSSLRLQQWDILCDSLPEAIRDSLNTMDPRDLSPDSRAWYGLLKTITDDKTYTLFTSDSLINSVENYYQRHNQESRNHIRSLIYQGIVRVRMGVTDSTAYEPLKKALAILHTQKDPNPTLLYFANYYIGHIHRKSNNDDPALYYFQQALTCAKHENKVTHLFDIYQRLFQLRMSEKEYDDARLYIDTLTTYARTAEDKYYLLDAEAVYLDMHGEYHEALEKEKEQLVLADQLKKKPDYFRIYYSLSDRYYQLTLLDSALYYVRQAIAHIEDSTYRLNYLLYDNAADIAVGMNDYRLADNFRRQALESYSISVEERLDTQIHELEKRYDLAEAENRALKTGNRLRFIVVLSVFGLLFTVILIRYFNKQRALGRLRQAKLTEEKNRAEAESNLFREQSENQRQLLSRYDSFLKFHAEQQQQILRIADKMRSKYPLQGDAYDKMLEMGRQRFNRLVKELFTAEDMQRMFDIRDDQGILTESDRLLLFMLANHAHNEQIAALLNTNVNNLKSKKSYLKKKIAQYATSDNGFQRLLTLF